MRPLYTVLVDGVSHETNHIHFRPSAVESYAAWASFLRIEIKTYIIIAGAGASGLNPSIKQKHCTDTQYR